MKKFFQHFFDLVVMEGVDALKGIIVRDVFAPPVGVIGEATCEECEIHPNFHTNSRELSEEEAEQYQEILKSAKMPDAANVKKIRVKKVTVKKSQRKKGKSI